MEYKLKSAISNTYFERFGALGDWPEVHRVQGQRSQQFGNPKAEIRRPKPEKLLAV
jgi:hypothetical protein